MIAQSFTLGTPSVSEELNSVETTLPERRYPWLQCVSEELNSVETLPHKYEYICEQSVSEELNSVETLMQAEMKDQLSRFQKNLIVWKLACLCFPERAR